MLSRDVCMTAEALETTCDFFFLNHLHQFPACDLIYWWNVLARSCKSGLKWVEGNLQYLDTGHQAIPKVPGTLTACDFKEFTFFCPPLWTFNLELEPKPSVTKTSSSSLLAQHMSPLCRSFVLSMWLSFVSCFAVFITKKLYFSWVKAIILH